MVKFLKQTMFNIDFKRIVMKRLAKNVTFRSSIGNILHAASWKLSQ